MTHRRIEDLREREIHIRRLNVVKILILLKLIYRFNIILIKVLAGFYFL